MASHFKEFVITNATWKNVEEMAAMACRPFVDH